MYDQLYDSDVPLAERIANTVRSAILAGVYKPGEALPSVRELARASKHGKNAVNDAYAILAQEGYIEVSHGRRPTVSALPAIKQTQQVVLDAHIDKFLDSMRLAGYKLDDVRKAVKRRFA